MNVSFTFFNNYHLAAKEFANGDMAVYGRLMFIVNTYAIEGVIIEDMNPAEKLFLTSIKASIDKSLRLTEAGRKGGSYSANKPEETTAPDITEDSADNTASESSFFVENNEACKPLKKACKPFKKACNEEEEEEEKEEEFEQELEEEKETEKNKKGKSPDSSFSVLFGSDFIPSSIQKKVIDWIFNKNFRLNNKNKHYILDIADFLEKKHLEINFLDYVFFNALSEYETTNRNLGLIFNAFSWETTIKGYETIHKHTAKNIKARPPKKCSICGSGLVERLNNLVECPECRNRGNPIWWELEPITNKWVCSNEDSK